MLVCPLFKSHEFLIGRRINNFLLLQVAGIEHGFGAEETEGFEPKFFLLIQIKKVGRLSLVELRNQAFKQGDIGSRILILTASLFFVFLKLAGSGFNIGQNQFGHDDLRISNRIHPAHVVNDILILKATDHMGDGIDLPHIGEELIPQTLALTCPGHQSGNVNHLNGGRNKGGGSHQFGQRFQPGIRDLHHADIWIDGAEWIVGRLRLSGFSQGVEESAFTHIGQTYDSSLKHNQ